MPLRRDGHRALPFAEAQEAAVDADRDAGLLHRHAEDGVEVELRANLAADRGDEPLPLERLGERVGGARPVERERGLGGEGLQERSSSPLNTFGAFVVASTSTAGTLSSETSGTKTALFAPTFSASRGLTRCEPATSYTTTGPPSKTALAIADGSLLEVERDIVPPGRVHSGRQRLEPAARARRPR